jgi:septal ring factor EnvC (AmiA/AmiB activator)
MNRTFFLTCATFVTLSIAAASAAQAQPCSEKPTERERQACLIRSAIYTAVSRAEAAAASTQQARAQQQAQKAAAVRAQQQAAAARATKPTAASSPEAKPTATSSPPEKSCGVTEYTVDGAVKFQDTCTGEWIQQDNNTLPKQQDNNTQVKHAGL